MSALLERTTGIGRAAWAITVLFAIAVEVLNLIQRRVEWTASTYGLVDWHQGSAVLIGAGTAGIAAYSAARLRRSVLGDRAEASGEEGRVVARIALGIAAANVVVFLAALVAHLVVAHGTGLRGPYPFVHELGGLALLVALPALGATAGWITGSVLAAPMTMLLAFFGLSLLGDTVPNRVFDFLSVTDGVGLTADVGFNLVRGAAVLAVAGAAILLAMRGAKVRWPGVAALAVLIAALASIAPETVTPQRAAMVCGGSRVTVCAAPERRERIEDVSRAIAELRAPLDAVLPAALRPPVAYREDVPRGTARHAALTVADDRREEELVYDVADGVVRCYDLAEGVPEGRQADAADLLVAWVATRGRTAEPTGELAAMADLLPRSPAKAEAAVRRAAKELRPCSA